MIRSLALLSLFAVSLTGSVRTAPKAPKAPIVFMPECGQQCPFIVFMPECGQQCPFIK